MELLALQIDKYPEFRKGFYVYALICEAKKGQSGYVKFGVTINVDSRLSALKCGCPVPIKYVGLIEVDSKEGMRHIEALLHKKFEHRKLHGEWFGFDFLSIEDKKDFNDGCKQVFKDNHFGGITWSKYSFKQIQERSYPERCVISNLSAEELSEKNKDAHRKKVLEDNTRLATLATKIRNANYSGAKIANSSFWKP